MQALILAGGLGTRLRSIVSDQPKPMADIENKPFLAHQIEYLRQQGVSHVILCVGYLHDHVMSYFGDGDLWGIPIDYSIESSPLGTGGAVKHAEHFVDGAFLLLNGDSFFDINLQQLVRFHQEQKKADMGCVGTVALTNVPDTSRYGSVLLDQQKRIVDFVEKGDAGLNHDEAHKDISGLINAGVYALEPDILEVIPAGQKVSLERTIFPSLMKSGSHLYGFESDGFFVDIGTPEGYYEFCTYTKGRSSSASNEHLSKIGV